MPTGIIIKKKSFGRRLLELTLVIGLCAGIFFTAVMSEAEVLGPTIEIPDSVVKPVLILADSTKLTKENKASKFPEIPANFPGGYKALLKYLSKEVRYPRKAAKNKIEGRVLVKFVINEKGYVTKPSILQGVSPELDTEALRLVKSLPRWNPAWDDGKRVPCYYALPINFQITEGYVPEKNDWLNQICEFFLFLSGVVPIQTDVE